MIDTGQCLNCGADLIRNDEGTYMFWTHTATRSVYCGISGRTVLPDNATQLGVKLRRAMREALRG